MIKKRTRPAIAGGRPERSTFLVFGAPQIEEEDIQAVVQTLRSRWIGTGPRTIEFEDAFRRYRHASCAIAVNSCTAALHLSLLALGLKKGDEVITTPMTFCASANAILHAGAKVVLADCLYATQCIDPAQIERLITPRTRAILPVHFAGRPCDMDAILKIARKHKLFVVEDCAHAIETNYHGRAAGTLGDAGCFSFYVTKNVVTGEGGMVLTPHHRLEERIKRLALHGMTKDAWKRFGDSGYRHYQVLEAGFKYNMTDVQASLGLQQLKRVEANWKRRDALWKRYDAAFADLPCERPLPAESNTRHGRHLYTLMLDLKRLSVNRDFILNALTKENVGVGVHYIALHLQPFYRTLLKVNPADFPNATAISRRTLSLPLSAALTDADAESVIRAVRKVLLYYQRDERTK